MTPAEALKVILEQKVAYQLAFGSPAGKSVLADLSEFCRAKRSCFVVGDSNQTLIAEGKREVFLRIEQYLELTPEELFPLLTTS